MKNKDERLVILRDRLKKIIEDNPNPETEWGKGHVSAIEYEIDIINELLKWE